jgi:tryptophan-rich sensory protein
MAVAAWLVWRKHGFSGARTALWLFVIQLFANALWTWLFFVLHRGALSLAEIAVLWLLIAATITAFCSLQRLAALLLVSYSRVGKLRFRAYLVFVAVESCGSWLAAMLWPNPSIEKASPGEPGDVPHLKR